MVWNAADGDGERDTICNRSERVVVVVGISEAVHGLWSGIASQSRRGP